MGIFGLSASWNIMYFGFGLPLFGFLFEKPPESSKF